MSQWQALKKTPLNCFKILTLDTANWEKTHPSHPHASGEKALTRFLRRNRFAALFLANSGALSLRFFPTSLRSYLNRSTVATRCARSFDAEPDAAKSFNKEKDWQSTIAKASQKTASKHRKENEPCSRCTHKQR
jgi:hypothetical protein